MILFNNLKLQHGRIKEELESSNRFSSSILSIPIYPELNKKEIEKIVSTINRFKE